MRDRARPSAVGGALWIAGSTAVLLAILGRISAAVAATLLLVALVVGHRSASGSRARGAARLAFSTLFALYVAATIAFLLAGLWPALVHAFPVWHQSLHRLGGTGPFSSLARNAAQASHTTQSLELIMSGYLFSSLGVGLGIFLVRLRPHDLAARMLAVGMIGTAALFNLQAHNALTVFPILAGTLHDMFHLVAGVAYVLALLLFPTGEFVPRWSNLHGYQWPLRVAYIAVFVFVSMVVVDNFHGDNPTGWVVFFGILIPIAGISSQLSRYRHPSTVVERQQSRLLVWVLMLALGMALLWVSAFSVLAKPGRALSKTVTYEFESPGPGRYSFVCDPHPYMHGTAVFTPDDSAARSVSLVAHDFAFSSRELVFPARTKVAVQFTNKDGEAHNLAIYSDEGPAKASTPVFVGALFSAHPLADLAFVVFPALFSVIPTTLFIVLVRYRLWDMDRVVSRALVYSLLSGTLAATYWGCVVVLQPILNPLTGTDLAVAGSTLAVAALFRPARGRIQAFIDRSFHRARYDAQRTIEAFGAKLRHEVELQAVTNELLAAARETMQPAHVSLWLRPFGERH
jgi:plastocyanin